MRTTIKIIIVAILLALAISCKAQTRDTSIVTMYVKDCKESSKGFPVSPSMHKYIDTYKKISMIVEITYSGNAIIDEKYRECVTIYRVTFKLSNR